MNGSEHRWAAALDLAIAAGEVRRWEFEGKMGVLMDRAPER